MNFSIKVSMEGDPSREASFTLEPLHEGVDVGTWRKEYQSGVSVLPTSGNWSYMDDSGEIWLSENTDGFCSARVDRDWSKSLIDGTTVMGQGWLMTNQGGVNVLYTMASTG